MDWIGALGFWIWAQYVASECLLGYNEISEYMMKFLQHLKSPSDQTVTTSSTYSAVFYLSR